MPMLQETGNEYDPYTLKDEVKHIISQLSIEHINISNNNFNTMNKPFPKDAEEGSPEYIKYMEELKETMTKWNAITDIITNMRSLRCLEIREGTDVHSLLDLQKIADLRHICERVRYPEENNRSPGDPLTVIYSSIKRGEMYDTFINEGHC